MKVGLVLPMFSGDTERVLMFARTAEELGFDGLFAFDHLFPPGAPSDRPSLEAFTTLSAVAATTRTLAVGTLVTRASLRTAGLIAKLATTVDDVSGGRMILGIGTGDPLDRPEHEVFGLPYLNRSERREHLIETVRAVRALFDGELWEGGRYVPPISGPLLPRPVTAGGPPIWIGGFADAVVRLAGKEADAWNGWGMSPDEFERKARLLRETADEAGRAAVPTWAGIVVVGRDDEEVAGSLRERERKGLEQQVWSGSDRALVDWLRWLEGVGATWAVLVAGGRQELIAEHVLPHVPKPG